MSHCMLARQGKPCSCWFSDTKLLEYRVILVKPLEGIIQGIQYVFGECAHPCNVTKVKVCIETLNNVLWHIPFNCWHPNLGIRWVTIITPCRYILNLHQGFGVITSPLLKVLTLFKAAETRKWWGQGDPSYGSMYLKQYHQNIHDSLPINFIQDHFTLCFSMFFSKILCHPFNEVVFEHSLDDLVQEVQGDQFVDICMGEVFSKWLRNNKMKKWQVNGLMTYNYVVNNPVIFPNCLGIKCRLTRMGMLLGP